MTIRSIERVLVALSGAVLLAGCQPFDYQLTTQAQREAERDAQLGPQTYRPGETMGELERLTWIVEAMERDAKKK